MPSQYNAIIDAMQAAWNESNLKDLYQSSSLGQLLSQAQRPTPGQFFQTYLSSTVPNQQWFRSLLTNLRSEFDALTTTASLLLQNHIFTQEHVSLVMEHDQYNNLAFVIGNLDAAQILTQENLNALLLPAHQELLSQAVRGNVWSRIPNHLLNQNNFRSLLRATHDANSQIALNQTVTEILFAQQTHFYWLSSRHNASDLLRAILLNRLNPFQSTHTASVHKSVSESAAQLMQVYGQGLDLEKLILELTTYVEGLDDSAKHQAAKRGIKRLADFAYVFEDQVSGVSTRQLLALSWMAIHDDAKRQGSVQDAKAMFIEGLYEIQRGYNIDVQGCDDGEDDKPICTAGTFNKLLEKLQGIHPDVHVLYITKQGASNKLPIVVKGQLLAYLKTASAEVLETFQKAQEISEELWTEIRANIKAELNDYKPAFASEAEFDAFIDAGRDLDIGTIDIQAQQRVGLVSSQGMFASSSSSAAAPSTSSSSSTAPYPGTKN